MLVCEPSFLPSRSIDEVFLVRVDFKVLIRLKMRVRPVKIWFMAKYYGSKQGLPTPMRVTPIFY